MKNDSHRLIKIGWIRYNRIIGLAYFDKIIVDHWPGRKKNGMAEIWTRLLTLIICPKNAAGGRDRKMSEQKKIKRFNFYWRIYCERIYQDILSKHFLPSIKRFRVSWIFNFLTKMFRNWDPQFFKLLISLIRYKCTRRKQCEHVSCPCLHRMIL